MSLRNAVYSEEGGLNKRICGNARILAGDPNPTTGNLLILRFGHSVIAHFTDAEYENEESVVLKLR